MKVYVFCFLILVILNNSVESKFPNVYPRLNLEAKPQCEAGEPLFLTPYLKNGSITLAQNLAQVPLTEKIGFRSYAGFLTVDEKYDSNQYFWYFPPFSKNADAPVILWLQGGPGVSSLYGLFVEVGPLIGKQGGFAMRKYHWALNNHIIFIDNPVGTGFSFTNNEEGYCNDEDCVGKGVYNSLQQFFTLFPTLLKNEFYIVGESYAGKFVPAVAMEIHNQNAVKKGKLINLKGMMLGNPYCDPINQSNYGAYLYYLGLIDDNQLKIFEDMQEQIVAELKKKDWPKALLLMDKLMDGELNDNFSYFRNFTGYNYYYNFLQTEDTSNDTAILMELLNNNNVRRSVHVGNLTFNTGVKVAEHLLYDIPQSVAPFLTELLSHYRILFYSGQLDLLIAYPYTLNVLRNLNFSAADEYKTAPRHIWRVDKDLAGYYKKAGNLTEVLVRNAGHIVPSDQPKWVLDMLTRFLNNKM